MTEDPELGFILKPSVLFKNEIPEAWTVISLLEFPELYDITELIEYIHGEFPANVVEDVLITNPCIFTTEDGFMYIGYIATFIFNDKAYIDEDDEHCTVLKDYLNYDRVTLPCVNSVHGLDWPCDLHEINQRPYKVTEWPINVMLPDSTL
jgi:hypothetical protein